MKYRTDLTADFVRQILDYDPTTGLFTWKHRGTHPKKWNAKWAGKQAGTQQRGGYILININNPYAAHRLAWLHFYGEIPITEIDHRNGIRDDNRIANLRLATTSQNACNKAKQSNNTSGFVGVHFNSQRGLWRATANKNNTRYDVGHFKTAEGAAAARADFIADVHGEFAAQDPDRAKYLHWRDVKKGA